jgi:hypothetical protein
MVLESVITGDGIIPSISSSSLFNAVTVAGGSENNRERLPRIDERRDDKDSVDAFCSATGNAASAKSRLISV